MRRKRNFFDKKYIRWRNAVYRRDGYKCRMPTCSGACKGLNAHHIKRWANYPELRFVVSNGITLCIDCHKLVGGKEESYEHIFMNITGRYGRKDIILKMILMRNENVN